MIRSVALLFLLCSVALARPDTGSSSRSSEQVPVEGQSSSSGQGVGSGSVEEYGSGSGSEGYGSGSGVEQASGDEYGSANETAPMDVEFGSGSGVEQASGDEYGSANETAPMDVEFGSGSGVEQASGDDFASANETAPMNAEFGSGSGLEQASGDEYGTSNETAPMNVESGSGSGSGSGEPDSEIIILTGDAVNVFTLKEDSDVVLYQEAANIYNQFGSGTYNVSEEDEDEDADVPKSRAARAVSNSTVVKTAPKDTSANETDTCQQNSVCYSDSECGAKGHCLGVFVGKCNCNACINLLSCEDDSACGGLQGACTNTTLNSKTHCECLKAYKLHGFATFMETLQKLCNVKECGRNTDTCFGLPCNSGRCVC